MRPPASAITAIGAVLLLAGPACAQHRGFPQGYALGNSPTGLPSAGLTPTGIQIVQRKLKQEGFYNGPINGEDGPAYHGALRNFQLSRHLTDTSTADPDTLAALGLTEIGQGEVVSVGQAGALAKDNTLSHEPVALPQGQGQKGPAWHVQPPGVQPGQTARDNSNRFGGGSHPAVTTFMGERQVDGIGVPISADKAPGEVKSGPPIPPRTTLLSKNGDVRLSQLIGHDLRNEQGDSLGKIEDVFTGKTGSTEVLVLVKVDNHEIAVPWNRLVFDAGTSHRGTVLLPGETRDALERQAPFKPGGNG